MPVTNSIKRIYVRRYRDNGQVTAYAEWVDGSRTESTLGVRYAGMPSRTLTFGSHMHAIFNRAKREGLKIERETW